MATLQKLTTLIFIFLSIQMIAQTKNDSINFEKQEEIEWPLIAGYQKIIPLGELAKNMDNLDGFHVGFQFKISRKYLLDIRIFGAFGGDSQKKRIFTYKKTDFESYIKSIYGASVSVQRFDYIIPKKLVVVSNVGIGAQMYNSDKENKYFLQNGVTGAYEESKDKKSEPIGSVAPLISLGTGLRYKFGDYPVGFNIGYNYAPHNVFGKMIQKGTGSSYLTFSLYAGFILPF